MSFEKFFNLVSLVPTGPIHIEPDGMATQSFIKVGQDGQESITVSLRRSNQTLPTQQRSDPSEHIQPFSMLTGGWNSQTFSSFGPSSTHFRMKCESGLVLENDGFTWAQRLEFFLYVDEISSRPPRGLEDRHGRLVSYCSPIDASNVGPGEPSTPSQTFSLNERPVLGHPSELAITQSPSASSRDGLPNFSERSCSIEPVAPAAVVPSALPPHLDSRNEPSDSSSYELAREHRLSTRIVAPPEVAIGLRSLFRSRLQEFPRPDSTNELASLRGAAA